MKVGKKYYARRTVKNIRKVGRSYYGNVVSDNSKGAIYLLTFGKKKRVTWNTHTKLGKVTENLKVIKSKHKLYPEYISKYDLAGVRKNVQGLTTEGTVKSASTDSIYRWDKSARSTISFDFKHDYSLNGLNRSAAVVVSGIVTKSSSESSENFPITVHNLKINKLYKNKPHLTTSELSFNQIGDKKTAVSQSALLRNGTHVILFLRKGENGTFNLINEGASIYVKNKSNGKYVNAANSHQYSLDSIVK